MLQRGRLLGRAAIAVVSVCLAAPTAAASKKPPTAGKRKRERRRHIVDLGDLSRVQHYQPELARHFLRVLQRVPLKHKKGLHADAIRAALKAARGGDYRSLRELTDDLEARHTPLAELVAQGFESLRGAMGGPPDAKISRTGELTLDRDRSPGPQANRAAQLIARRYRHRYDVAIEPLGENLYEVTFDGSSRDRPVTHSLWVRRSGSVDGYSVLHDYRALDGTKRSRGKGHRALEMANGYRFERSVTRGVYRFKRGQGEWEAELEPEGQPRGTIRTSRGIKQIAPANVAARLAQVDAWFHPLLFPKSGSETGGLMLPEERH